MADLSLPVAASPIGVRAQLRPWRWLIARRTPKQPWERKVVHVQPTRLVGARGRMVVPR